MTTTNYRNLTELSSNDLQLAAPSIFADHPSSHLSERYCQFRTSEVIEGLRSAGWAPVRAQEQNVRLSEREGFQKHMIKLHRRESLGKPTLGDSNIELILTNSHDGTSAYRLQAGIFRFVCLNGLVVGSEGFNAVSIRHNKRAVNEVVSQGDTLLSATQNLGDRLNSYRVRRLSQLEALDFARRAIELRYETLEEAPVRPSYLLEAKRYQDEGNSLWCVFNVVQENLTKGTRPDRQLAYSRRTRAKCVRKITAIDADIQINRALWQLADTYLLS
jgi:hypothetical protein